MIFRSGSFFAAISALVAGKAETNHTHRISDIQDFNSEVDDIVNGLLDLQKGEEGGLATLDGSGHVPSAQLPSYVDDVLEYATLSVFPVTGESGKIYVDLATNKTHRWSGSSYIEISPSPGSTDSITEGSTNLYFTNARAQSALNATVSAITGRLNDIEAHLAILPKRVDRYTATSDSSGDITINFPSGRYTNPPSLALDYVFNNNNHGCLYNIKAITKDTALLRVLRTRSVTVGALGGEVNVIQPLVDTSVVILATEI